MSAVILDSGGYSSHMYHPLTLREYAVDLSHSLPALMAKHNADTIVVTGKSGMALAFATMMLMPFNLCVVRKRGDGSHGNRIEGPSGHRVSRYVILDDFISSGNTVETIRAELIELAQQSGKDEPEPVAIVEYTKTRSDYCDRGREKYRCLGNARVPIFGRDGIID